MSRVRILYLIDKLTAAGTQTNLLEIIKRLDRERFDPRVIALVAGGDLLPEFQKTGVPTLTLGVKKAYGPSGWKALSFLIRYFKEEKIDIVQTHFLHADLLGSIAAIFSRVPKVITTRRDEGFWRGKRQLALNRFLNGFADKILVNSEAVKEAVCRNENGNQKKIHLIYNGVDLARYFPSPELGKKIRQEFGIASDELVVAMIANMRHEVKGHRYLIRAIPMIKKEMPGVKFMFVGDGPLRAHLERYASYFHVLDSIIFTGSRRDIPALLNAADIIAVPSLSEGFSNTILEAMAAAKPVVVTNVGGNPEVVLGNETGFLVRPRDGQVLGEKLLLLLHNKNLRLEMGEAALRHVRAFFTIEKMANEYEAFYEELSEFIERPPYFYRPIKVMHLIWSLDLGGAEQVVMDLARKLNRTYFEPMVCCLNEKGRFAPLLEQEGVRVVALHKKPKFDPGLLSKLIGLIKEEKIDLIHTHLFTANLWGRMAASLARVPVISSEHGMDTWRTWFHLTLDKLLTPVNKRIIFVSEGVKKFYSARNSSLNGKSRILYNGVDVTKFQISSDRQAVRKDLGINKTDRVIGIVGRLVPEKAHEDFIGLIQNLRDQRQDITGLIVGEGALLNELKERVKTAGLENHIVFTGHRSDLPQLYQVMDVFVLTSLREGFPVVVLEAMAAGVPVVATEVGGINECVEHEKNGLLVPAGDRMALLQAVLRILEDKTFKEEIVRHAKEKVTSRFSIANMVEAHEALYTEVLGK